MGEYWQYSFQMGNIPANFINELKKGLKEIFCTDIETYFNKYTNSYSIEIFDEQVYGNNSFFKWCEEELKKRIWKNGFLEFKFAIAPVPLVVPRFFTEDDYKKFKKIDLITWFYSHMTIY